MISLRDIVDENLRNWFKKEKWVRVSTSGKILGPCGKKKAQKNPARCLPYAKAKSLSKKDRAKTARKKKRGGSKGKQFVKNTKKAKVRLKKEIQMESLKDIKDIIKKVLEKEGGAAGLKPIKKAVAKADTPKGFNLEKTLDTMGGVKQHKHGDYISTPLSEVKNTIEEMLDDYRAYEAHCMEEDMDEAHCMEAIEEQCMGEDVDEAHCMEEDMEEGHCMEEDMEEGHCMEEDMYEGKKKKKADRCKRKADSVYGKKTSAYKSGAIVKCRKGMIWKKKNESLEEKKELKNPKKADLNKDGKLSSYEKTRGKAIEKAMGIEEYDVVNEEDTKDFVEFMKENYLNTLEEAEYKGRKVKLGKPMRGDVKKFKVYVKNPKGNVVKVNFGQKGMNIKKNNPKRRKPFRARHNCDNPGPRHKARYWSCKKW